MSDEKLTDEEKKEIIEGIIYRAYHIDIIDEFDDDVADKILKVAKA